MDNLPVEKPMTDISEKDLVKVQKFIDSGLPGIMTVTQAQFSRMAEMYMNGSTYWQISNALEISRALVMFVSRKYGWYEAKQEYLAELQEKIKGRVIDSKLASQDFILLLIQAYQKKIGQKLKKYLATDDAANADEINLKEIDKLLKAIEMIQTLNSDGKSSSGKTPAVGLNLGDGVTIERSGDNKVTITPNMDKQLGSLLKKFADSRREEQNKNTPSSDSEEPNQEDKKNED